MTQKGEEEEEAKLTLGGGEGGRKSGDEIFLLAGVKKVDLPGLTHPPSSPSSHSDETRLCLDRACLVVGHCCLPRYGRYACFGES